MADVVYLPDGTKEVILTDRETFLKRLLTERLGRDVANCFIEYIHEIKSESNFLKESYDEQEKIADGYIQRCRDSLEVFQRLDVLAKASRLDRKALQNVITEGIKQLQNNL